MITLTIKVKSSDIPILKHAARLLQIEMVAGEYNGERTEVTLMILDYYDLILLGQKAGSESAWISIANPLQEAIDSLENKIDKFKKDNPYDNKL